MRSKFANRSRSEATTGKAITRAWALLAVGEPGEHGLAREPPLAAELAARQIAGLGQLGDRRLLDLQPLGELRGREYVGRSERAELGVPDGEPVVGGLDGHAPQRVGVAEAGDQARDQVLLRAPEPVGGLVEAPGLGGGEAYVEGGAVHGH